MGDAFNNGTLPEPGLVWSGDGNNGGWVWPANGVLDGDTLTVWPAGNSDNRLPETIFNPATGNGFVPAVDGFIPQPPRRARPEVLTAVNKIKKTRVL